MVILEVPYSIHYLYMQTSCGWLPKQTWSFEVVYAQTPSVYSRAYEGRRTVLSGKGIATQTNIKVIIQARQNCRGFSEGFPQVLIVSLKDVAE